MNDALEAALDALFQRPLGEFVRARDELARELRRAGDAASAAQVKGLKRPTPAAWALNQVHFCESGLLLRAQACAAELRALHAREGVSAEALRAALEAQRAATHAVVEAALSRGQSAGMVPNPTQQRRLFATVQGLLSGLGPEAPGRLTSDLEPSGFEALAGAEIAAAAPGRPAQAPEAASGAPQGATARAAPAASREREGATRERELREARERKLREQRRKLGEFEAQLREASELVRRAARARERAHRERAEAEARVREAEQALSALREALSARDAEAGQADAQLAEAEAKRSQAAAALEEARAALPGSAANPGQDPQPPSG